MNILQSAKERVWDPLMTPHGQKVLGDRSMNIAGKLFRFLFLLGMAYVLLYPVLFLLSNAFRDPIDRLDPTVIWLPKHVTLNNFVLADQVLDFAGSMGRTLMMTLPSVIIQVFICMLVGYGFARFKFKEKELLFSMLIFTIIVPVNTIIIPLYVNFRYFDFLGIGQLMGLFTGTPVTVNLLGENANYVFYILSFFGMGIRSGLYIFIARQFFRGMPAELEEAAFVDGCGPFATYFRIMVPNIGSAMLVIILFSLVWHWNDYYMSVTFFAQDYPLSVGLTVLTERLSTMAQNLRAEDIALMRSSILEAACLLVIGPILVLYIVMQRYFTESITRAGIVG